MSIDKLRNKIVSEFKKININSAEIDAEIIFAFVTKKSKEFLLANPDFKLTNREVANIEKLVERRKNGEPIAYIVGKKEFFGLDFFLTPDVFIPRPETEMIVDLAIDKLKVESQKPKVQGKELRILDVGTGSGNIIISIAKTLLDDNFCKGFSGNSFAIAKLFPLMSLNFFATDISEKALKAAKKNAKLHQVIDKIKFYKSDLFSNKQLPKIFDLIVANLPYVPKNKKLLVDSRLRGNDRVRFNNLQYEPQNAIFADNNGTKIIKKFLDQVENKINIRGTILIEVDPRNAKELKNYAKKYFKKVELKKDLTGRDRLITIRDFSPADESTSSK